MVVGRQLHSGNSEWRIASRPCEHTDVRRACLSRLCNGVDSIRTTTHTSWKLRKGCTVPSIDEEEEELLDLSQRLLDSIDQQDWPTYSELCDSTLSAFEPEALGHLVEGMEFHEFYFKLESDLVQKQSTISSPNVRLMNDSAVITYIRVSQVATVDTLRSTACEETRIWQKINDKWQHVHFHRSIPAS
jgi:hypothetical protein